MHGKKSMGLVGGFALILVVVPVLAGWPQGDAAEDNMPEGEGRALVRSVCSTCHSLQQALGQPRTKERWQQTVDDMISRGAQIFPDEMEQIVNYLSVHYSPGSASPAAAPAQPAAVAAAPQVPPSAAQELLTSKCFQCHGDGMWRDMRQSRRDWEATLYRMVGRGALWTEEEISRMADHLAEINGPR